MNLAYWWDTAKLWVKKTAQKVALELTVWVFEFAIWAEIGRASCRERV